MGKIDGGKNLTLSEAEAWNTIDQESEQPHIASKSLEYGEALAASQEPSPPPSSQHDDTSPADNDTKPASAYEQVIIAADCSAPKTRLRLYTTENRMWYTITGHAPDPSKVKGLDFACLSIIASHGPEGILQPDLIKISGQDKRSLPHRTDRLHDDGYIEKKRARLGGRKGGSGQHTSLCTLKRFVKDIVDQRQQPVSTDHSSNLTGQKSGMDIEGQVTDEDPVAARSDLPVAEDSARVETPLSSASGSVPQWIAERSISNQVFDLVEQSGTKGVTTNVCPSLIV